MLYINDENDIYGYDGKVDLETIKAENYDSAYIMLNDEIIADITLVIYNKNEVFSEEEDVDLLTRYFRRIMIIF